MTVCYCRTGGYGRFLQVVEQKAVDLSKTNHLVGSKHGLFPSKNTITGEAMGTCSLMNSSLTIPIKMILSKNLRKTVVKEL